jgi:hypothetical protein
VLSRITPTSIANVASSASINAYPNPVSGNLNIQLSNAAYGNYTIAVYDLMGKQVATQTTAINGTSTTVSIDAASWAPGAYNAVVEHDGARQVVQVVKQ